METWAGGTGGAFILVIDSNHMDNGICCLCVQGAVHFHYQKMTRQWRNMRRVCCHRTQFTPTTTTTFKGQVDGKTAENEQMASLVSSRAIDRVKRGYVTCIFKTNLILSDDQTTTWLSVRYIGD